MWRKVVAYIKENKLLNDNDLYIVALSGGADSVALLLLLKELGYNIHAAHCNFHLRGQESDRDEQFCINLCERLGIELHRAHFDTQTYTRLNGVSIEMAARELRYHWFWQLCQDIEAVAVCVAHHRDDLVETVLINLVRGSGLRGLTGIQPRSVLKMVDDDNSGLLVLRPFLEVSRAEIEDYLFKKNQGYVTDSTNLETDMLRNKVRLKLLPLLCELNPAVAENIQRTAGNLTEAQRLLDAVVEPYMHKTILDISELVGYGSSEYIIYEWAKNYGFNGSQLKKVMSSSTGSVFTSRKGFDLLVDRGKLIVEPQQTSMESIVVPEEGTYMLPSNAFLDERFHHIVIKYSHTFYISKAPYVATVDADKVLFPLLVRRVENGDRMIPFGMKGQKLLSDLMTDCKLNLFEKRSQLVVVDARGIVIWVIGLRIDLRVAVSENTRKVLEISFN